MGFMSKKYPIVRQYDQIDCAPAALLSVLRYYGGDDTIVHARELCETSIMGSTMFSLVKAAKELGFEAKGATGNFEDLIKEKMPCSC